MTRKITWNAARIKLGLTDQKLHLGNPDARRDWGFAGDYVEAMWLMLQQDQPEDYVIATGETFSVRQFIDVAFGHLDLSVDEHVVFNDPRYTRPAEVDLLVGDPAKAGQQLGWEPRVSFQQLVTMMVDADIKMLKDGLPTY